jgi:L-alanine-DL-glutamate epimerase-like enolase superfamily enzyme
MHDLFGEIFGVSCYKLFGSWTDKIRLSWCVDLKAANQMVEEGKERIENYGFKALNLKAGSEPKKDIAKRMTKGSIRCVRARCTLCF